jgi:hypothetical protein
MNDLGFDIDETNLDTQSRGVGVDAARSILLACFTRLVDQALNWHRRDAEARAWREAYHIRIKQQPDEEFHDWFGRSWQEMLSAPTDAPVVPEVAQSGIRITTGGGKSEAFRQAIATRYIPEAKQLQLPHRVLVAVPTHKLADEARTKMPPGVTVAIWQGLKATRLGTNEPMCLNHAAVDAALALGADVETTACRRGQRGGPPIVCPFYEGDGQCHYQAQKAEAFAADVLFVAHEGLFKLPPGVCNGFGLVIIDEGFWQKGLSGAREDDRPRLAIGGLCEEFKDFPVRTKDFRRNSQHERGKARREAPKQEAKRRVSKREAICRRKALKRGEKARQYGREALRRKRKGRPKPKRARVASEPLTQELREMTERLQAACAASPDGYVQRAALEAAGLGSGNAYRWARAMEWLRTVDHGLKPDATPQRRDDAVKRFGFLAQIKQRVEMWHAVGELLNGTEAATGQLRIETVTTKEGSIRWLYISGRRRIDKRLMRLPIVYADATLPLELTRYYLPQLELKLDLVITEPHGRLIQAIGHPVGKSSLVPKEPGERRGKRSGAWTETPEQAEARVTRKRGNLVEVSRHLTQGRRGLVIVYKDIEKDFEGIEGVETGHFGAVEGIDRWGEVKAAVIIGRPMPKAQDVERMAAAITGRPVEAVSERCEREVCGTAIKCRSYTDLDAERVRAAVVEAAIEQSRGRVRAVNRTSANPVEVYLILHDVVVPGMPVDEVVEFRALEPSAVDEMVCRGLVPQWPSDAAKLHPDLFTAKRGSKPSREAAKKAYQRAQLTLVETPRGVKLGTSLHKEYLIKRCPQFGVRYRPRGKGSAVRLVCVDPIKVPDIRARLEGALGKLDLFELIGPWPVAVRDAPYPAQTASG